MSSLGIGLGITALTASLQVNAAPDIDAQQAGGMLLIPVDGGQFINGNPVDGHDSFSVGVEISEGPNYAAKIVRMSLDTPTGWVFSFYTGPTKVQKIDIDRFPILTACSTMASTVYISVDSHPAEGGSVTVPLAFDVVSRENYAPGTQADLIRLMELPEGHTATLNRQTPTVPSANSYNRNVPGRRLLETISEAANFAGETHTVQVTNNGSYYSVCIVPSLHTGYFTTANAPMGEPEGAAMLISLADVNKLKGKSDNNDYENLEPYKLTNPERIGEEYEVEEF